MSLLDPWNDMSYDAAAVDAASPSLLAGLGSTPAEVLGYAPGTVLPGDYGDSAKMSAFVPGVAQKQGMSWWESAVQYGLVRAIDNRYGSPTQVYGNVQPGYFAGQNGRTYANTKQPIMAADMAGGGLLGWLLIGGLVYAVLKS